MIRRFRDFDIQLNIKNDAFISPPREAQRRWLLGNAVDELASNLTHLDEISKKFIPGSEYATIRDRSNTELNEQEVMEDWQFPLMKAMANVATAEHGNLLEVGFGRGVSSEFIQQQGVKSHTIIECNDHIVTDFYEPWRARYPDRDIRLVHSKWQDAAEQLDVYDAIFFHTYALDESEYIDTAVKSVTFAEHFFPTAAKHLRDGGVFTYLTHEIDSFSRPHQRLVFKYFRSFQLELVDSLKIPENSEDAWWADSMVVIRAVK